MPPVGTRYSLAAGVSTSRATSRSSPEHYSPRRNVTARKSMIDRAPTLIINEVYMVASGPGGLTSRRSRRRPWYLADAAVAAAVGGGSSPSQGTEEEKLCKTGAMVKSQER